MEDFSSKGEYGRVMMLFEKSDGIEGVDFVVCPICGKRFKQISSLHLRFHYGIDCKDRVTRFKQEFPDCLIMCQKSSKLRSQMISKRFKGIKRSAEFGRKVSKAKMGQGKGEIRGPLPLETRLKIAKSNIGKHPSLETRKKMSNFQKGRKHTEETKKKIADSHRGTKRSMESRKKQSMNRKGRYTGSEGTNWKGGISCEPYASSFTPKLREYVRSRDMHKCQSCYKHELELGYKLCVHHIDYDKQNSSLDNLISLCRVCHSRAVSNRRYWTDFYSKLVGFWPPRWELAEYYHENYWRI